LYLTPVVSLSPAIWMLSSAPTLLLGMKNYTDLSEVFFY
jgi:hypothetical protein